MPFVLRKENDQQNPTMTKLYGLGVTEGLLAYYEKRGNQTAFISLLAQGECDGIVKVFYAGFELREFSTSGVRQWRFHPGTKSTGFADPVQGRPELFPTFPLTLSNKAYIEVLLPAELSEGEEEPRRLKVIMRGARVYDYTYDPLLVRAGGVGGLVRSAEKTYSVNNLLVFLDMCIEVGKMPLSRFHRYGASAMTFKARCDELIEWQGGNTPVNTAWQNLTNVSAYLGDGGLSKTSGGTAWNGFAGSVETLATGVEGYFKVTPQAGTIKVGLIPATSPAPANELDFEVALQFNVTNGITSFQKRGGVNIVLDTWTPSDEYQFSIEGGAYVIRKNGVAMNLSAFAPLPVPSGDVRVGLAAFTSGSTISKSTIFSKGSATRMIPRYTAHLAFSEATPLPLALRAVMLRCLGCSWQDVNGGIRFYSSPDRAVVGRLTYDPTQSVRKPNIVKDKFSLAPRATEDKFNFFRWSYRNIDSPLLEIAYEYTDRPLLRALGADLNQTEVVAWGVASQSEVQRNGEAMARIMTDLDRTISVDGQADSYEFAKGDVIELSHDDAAYRESAPPKFIIIEEVFNTSSADERTFVVQAYNPAYYSDTAHGAIQQTIAQTIKSPFDAPPPVVSVDLVESGRALPDGTYMPVIRGTVQFASIGYPQRARVLWKKPLDAGLNETSILLVPNPANLQAAFELEGVTAGINLVQVVTESLTGVKLPSTFHVINQLTTTGSIAIPNPPTALTLSYDATGTFLIATVSPSPDRDIKQYEIYRVTSGALTLIDAGLKNEFKIPMPFPLSTTEVRAYARNRSGFLSTAYASAPFALMPAPVNLVLTPLPNPPGVDKVLTWDSGSGTNLLEKYVVSVRNASTNTLVRDPQVVDLPDTIPVQWNFVSETGGSHSTNVVSPTGSISSLGTGQFIYWSQQFNGDFSLEWDVDSRVMGSIFLIQSPPRPPIPGDPDGIALGISVTMNPTNNMAFIEGATSPGLERLVAAQSRFRIDVRNGLVTYYLNNIFWLPTFTGIKFPNGFKVGCVLTNIGEPVAMLNVRVRPFTPRQFLYTRKMQEANFPSGVPLTEKFEVTQLSANNVESQVATIIG